MKQRLAGRGSRLGAVLLDNVMMALSVLPGGLAAVSAAESYDNDGIGGALFLLVVGFVGFLGVQIYLLVQEGQTVGKRIVGIRIVDYNEGTLLGAGRILGMRQLLPGFIAGIPYVGWLFALVDVLFIFGEERRCIHDYMAQSKVVDGDAAASTAGGSTTARSAATDETEGSPSLAPTQSTSPPPDAGHSAPDPARNDPSPLVPPSLDRLRDVLRNLEELRGEGTITEEKFGRGRRKALTDFVEKTDADAEALLRGLRQLRDEGHLEAADVQTVKSIL